MVTLLKFYSEIVADDYEDGEQEETGCGHPVTAIAEQFGTLDEAISWFGKNYGYSQNLKDWEVEGKAAYCDRLCADHSAEQNGGWFEPTKEEINSWKSGKLLLYTEKVRITFA